MIALAQKLKAPEKYYLFKHLASAGCQHW